MNEQQEMKTKRSIAMSMFTSLLELTQPSADLMQSPRKSSRTH